MCDNNEYDTYYDKEDTRRHNKTIRLKSDRYTVNNPAVEYHYDSRYTNDKELTDRQMSKPIFADCREELNKLVRFTICERNYGISRYTTVRNFEAFGEFLEMIEIYKIGSPKRIDYANQQIDIVLYGIPTSPNKEDLVFFEVALHVHPDSRCITKDERFIWTKFRSKHGNNNKPYRKDIHTAQVKRRSG